MSLAVRELGDIKAQAILPALFQDILDAILERPLRALNFYIFTTAMIHQRLFNEVCSLKHYTLHRYP